MSGRRIFGFSLDESGQEDHLGTETVGRIGSRSGAVFLEDARNGRDLGVPRKTWVKHLPHLFFLGRSENYFDAWIYQKNTENPKK